MLMKCSQIIDDIDKALTDIFLMKVKFSFDIK